MLSPPITGNADLDTYLFDLHNQTMQTGTPASGSIEPADSNPIIYAYQYIHIKYADDNIGTNFSDSPTNRSYYGILNNSLTTESSNPTDYTWYQAAQNFGTTYLLYYQTIGGRQIKFNIATVNPGAGWVPDTDIAIDLDLITSSDALSSMFTASFTPSSLQVPRSGTPLAPNFTNIVMKLYGSSNGVIVQFSNAQTDSDVSFVNDTWRIGSSETTGNSGIAYNGITVGAPTLVGDHAEWPIPTAMTSPANVIVPVRYKNKYGIVTQAGIVIQQLVFVDSGIDGNKSDTAYLYQWSTVTPNNPNGTSTYDWATASNTNYTGTNGWSTTLAVNPGTAGIRLWVATKPVTDLASATTTSVSWASGFTRRVAASADGIKTATVNIYKWDVTIPSISGSATYTWSTNTYSPTTATSGWTVNIPSAPSVGYTLWQASVNLTEALNATTSSINWSTSSISPISYSGNDGAPGSSGSSSRISYARIPSNPTPVSATVTTTGSTSFPPSGSWSLTATWSGSDPSPSSTNSLYQTDGIYNPSTNQTVWSTPYISSLKVGQLSAISANMGTITAGSMTAALITSGTTDTYSGFRFSLGGTIPFTGRYSAIQGVNDNSTGSSYMGFNTYTGTAPSADGWPATAGVAYSVLHAGLGGWNSSDSLTGNTFRGVGLIGTGYYGSTAYWFNSTNIAKTESYLSGNDNAYFGVNSNAAVITQVYLANTTTNSAGVFRRGTDKELYIANADYAAVANVGKGRIYAADGFTPFTGAHDGLVESQDTFEQGDILIDISLFMKIDISNIICKMAKSTSANQKGVIGIFVEKYDVPPEDWDPTIKTVVYPRTPVAGLPASDFKDQTIDFTNTSGIDIPENLKVVRVNALGEGQINVCGENGNIEIGDLIVTSSIPGKGMKQSDDIIRTITVAKSRETVIFNSPTEVKQIACIYLAG